MLAVGARQEESTKVVSTACVAWDPPESTGFILTLKPALEGKDPGELESRLHRKTSWGCASVWAMPGGGALQELALQLPVPGDPGEQHPLPLPQPSPEPYGQGASFGQQLQTRTPDVKHRALVTCKASFQETLVLQSVTGREQAVPAL